MIRGYSKKLHRFVILAFPLFIGVLLATAVNAEELTAVGEVRVENGGESSAMFGLDVRAVEFSSDGKSLSFSVEVDQDIRAYLEANHAQAVVQFMVDADSDESTGGEVFGSSNAGFENTTVVYACKEENGMKVCAGDLEGAVTFVGEFETEAWAADSGMFMPVHDFGWAGGDAVIDGNRIQAAIPYEDVGGAPGKVIRISVAAGSGRPIDMPSVLLTLR
jgi:roadblock/LC7 domain-containing protein